MARKSVLKEETVFSNEDSSDYSVDETPQLDLESDLENDSNETKIEQANEGLNEIENEINEVDQQQVAVERYLEILESHVVPGYRVSSESFALIASSLNISKEDVDKDGIVKTVLKTLVALLKKAGELLKKAFEHIKNTWPLITANLTKLKDDLNTARTGAIKLTGNETVSLSSGSYLMRGGNFVGDSTTAINIMTAISGNLLKSVPKELTQLLKEVNGTSDLSTSAVTRKLISAHTQFDRTTAKKMFSKTMPGDKLISIEIKATGDYDNFIYTLEDDEAGRSSGKVDVTGFDTPTARAVLAVLGKLIADIEEYSNGFTSMSSALAAHSFDDIKDITKLGKEERATAQYAARLTAIKATRAYVLGNQRFCGYCITVVKQELALINNLIKQASG